MWVCVAIYQYCNISDKEPAGHASNYYLGRPIQTYDLQDCLDLLL